MINFSYITQTWTGSPWSRTDTEYTDLEDSVSDLLHSAASLTRL